MSNALKIAVPLLLVAAAGGAFWYLNQQKTTPVAPTGTNDPVVQTPVEDDKPKQPEVAPATGGTVETPPVDTERVDAAGPAGSSHADAAQGVSGRVLRPDGTPAVGARVLLLKSAVSDPLQVFINNKTGRITPPLSEADTDQNGEFALGVLQPGEAVDLRVVSDEFPEMSRQQLKVRSDDWYDAGDLQLQNGVVVQGRVLDSLTGAPVINAVVWLSSSSNSHAMVATPGRERGVQTQTDNGGHFRFTNGPRQGLINISAEAEGFAAGSVRNQQLKTNAPNTFDLTLERGRTITGVVVNSEGERVSGVKIDAHGLSVKTPQTETVYSGEDGEFVFPALRKGPYRLTANAPRFTEVEVPLALTDEDVKIVLSRRGTVRLQVLGSNNRPVKVYRLSLKRSFPNNPMSIGNVLEYPDRNVSPRDYDGDWAIIDGLPAGTFRFQLTERNHAKTLSPEFTITAGEETPVEVVAALTDGGAITGTVIDDRGQPVRGAIVTSDMNAGLAAQTGLFEMFRKMIPEKHTARQTRTDDQGRFKLGQLSFADYMLRVSHPKYCEGTAINISLEHEGQEVDAGVIQLQLGTIVEGITTVDGQPTGQVKVVISMPTNDASRLPTAAPKTPEEMQAAARMLFSTNVLSDGNGRYRMLKRVPPGTYKITAARHSQENPFNALLDMKQSEQQLVIAPGQESVQVNFNLSNR